jgi:hypothetical protein
MPQKLVPMLRVNQRRARAQFDQAGKEPDAAAPNIKSQLRDLNPRPVLYENIIRCAAIGQKRGFSGKNAKTHTRITPE